MSYFENEKNVEDYVKMAEGYDGRALIEVLATYMAPGSTVLELGMGPGVDLALLSERYQVTGSDSSVVFVERYRGLDPDADLVQLDAVNMDIERQYDCIYSNKVLHHLTRDELQTSFDNQAKVLNDGGLIFHSFWRGDGEEEHHGLRFNYYSEEVLRPLIGDAFEVLGSGVYDEMGEDDSFYVVMQKPIAVDYTCLG
jgi:SAM-dependent methyltransferase